MHVRPHGNTWSLIGRDRATYTVVADDIFYTPDLPFSDGFESGTTASWSSSVH